MTHLIEFASVSKMFNGNPAVQNLSFVITHGEFVAIMGPSGCGKTTALRLLAGFEFPDTGDVRFAGRRINEMNPWERDLPMVWQNLALFPFLSVLENVEFGLKMRGMAAMERRKKAMMWLDRLHIADFAGDSVEKLSGGQRQRVALARTLVTEPKILLLDEPLSALDANMVVHMEGVLSNLQKQLGITFLYVTHSRAEAFAMADRIIVMNKGEISQIGSPADIFNKPRNRFVAQFIGETNIFSGKLAGQERGMVKLETAEGVLWIKPPHIGVETAEIAVNVRDITVSRTSQSGFDNTLECDLESESYCGDFWQLQLRTRAGGELIAKVAVGDDWCPKEFEGGKLFAQWQGECAHFLEQESAKED